MFQELLHALGDDVLMLGIHSEPVAEVLAQGLFVGQIRVCSYAMGVLVDGYLCPTVAFAFVVVEQFEQFLRQIIDQVTSDAMSFARKGIKIHTVGGYFLVTGQDGLTALENVGLVIGLSGEGIVVAGDPAEQTAIHEGAVHEQIKSLRCSGHNTLLSGLAWGIRA